jgi:D-alanyl-D-alanine carboxypeptidase
VRASLRRATAALVLLLAAACGGGASTTGQASADVDAVAAAVRAEAEGYVGAAPGIAVHLRVGGQERTVTVGVAEVATATPLRPEHRFAVASVTKPMVATVIMSLVEDGDLALDDRVTDLLPGVVPHARGVRVEHLLDHTSGVLTYDHVPMFPGFGREPARRLVGTVRWADPMFEPGSEAAYSNTNYLLLGMIAERVTGEPIGRLLAERVFGPAGMTATTFGPAGVPPDALAHGYADGADVDAGSWTQPGADAGVVATVADVGHFLDALTGGELVAPADVATMVAGHSILGAEPYGLGVATISTRCGDAIGHEGGIPGFSTRAWTLVHGDRTVVVAINTSTASRSLADSLVETALCD